VDKKRNSAGSELLYEEMAEKIVVFGKVAHVHNFRRFPGDGTSGLHGGMANEWRWH
jgi:hypothetical protein